MRLFGIAGIWWATSVALFAAEPQKRTTLVPASERQAAVAKFTTMEDEGVVNAVPNAAAAEWLAANVPAFTCSNPEVNEIYWFRWWSLRKHLRRDEASGRWVFTEFITKPRPISSALGHQLMELRWLRDPQFANDVVWYWLRGNDGAPQSHLHKYSQ